MRKKVLSLTLVAAMMADALRDVATQIQRTKEQQQLLATAQHRLQHQMMRFRT